MKKFFKRFCTFLLGMIFMLVVEVGAVLGLGWYAFTGLTLENMGVTNDGKLSNGIDLGEFSNYSLDKFIKYISKAQLNPDAFTLDTLKEEGFDIIETLRILNVDVDSADARDIQAIKDIDILKLFSSDALDEINFGVVLTFLSKDDSGKYPLFSQSLRELLRQNSVGDLFEKDEHNVLQLLNVIKDAKLGAILSSTFIEKLEGGDYVYEASNPALELLGNLPLELITKYSQTKKIDLGYELNEGSLVKYGDMKLSEFISKLTCKTKDNYQNTLQNYQDYTDKTLKEMFVKDDNNVYNFKFDVILDDIKLGTIFSKYKCNNSATCKVHSNVNDCNGAWFDKITDDNGTTYQPFDNSTINGKIMSNLYDLRINQLIKGEFDVTLLCDGVYLGYAFGNQISNIGDASYCLENCTHADHNANYLWQDGNMQEVSILINKLSNLSLQDAMEGKIDILSIFDDLKVGELMGLKYDGTSWCEKVLCNNNGNVCPAHKGITSCDGNFVYKQVETVSLKGEINANLYDLTLSNFIDGNFKIDDIMKDMYLGKAFGYTAINKVGYCDLDCTHDNHDANYYWVNSSNIYVNDLYNKIANLSFNDAINGTLDLQTIINDVKIGSVLGNIYDSANSKWTDIDGNDIVANSVVDKFLYNLYSYTLNDLSNGTLQLRVLVDGVKIGELMGYTYNANEDWWYNGQEKVLILENIFASAELNDFISGKSIEYLFGDVYIYEILGHEKVNSLGANCTASCPSDVHYHNSDGTLVNAVNSIINDVQLKDIINGTFNVKDKVNDLYLKDFIDCSGTPLLTALQDCKISNLATKIDILTVGDIVEINENSTGLLKAIKNKNITNLESELQLVKLGSIFDYELVGDGNNAVWKKKHVHGNGCDNSCTKEYDDLSSLSLKLADKTLEQFSNDGLDVSEFTLGDIYTDEQLNSGIFNSLDKSKEGGEYATIGEIPVSEIPERLTTGLKKATCSDLQNYGIINFNEIPEGKQYSIAHVLDGKFGQGVWQQFTINQLLNELVYP